MTSVSKPMNPQFVASQFTNLVVSDLGINMYPVGVSVGDRPHIEYQRDYSPDVWSPLVEMKGKTEPNPATVMLEQAQPEPHPEGWVNSHDLLSEIRRMRGLLYNPQDSVAKRAAECFASTATVQEIVEGFRTFRIRGHLNMDAAVFIGGRLLYSDDSLEGIWPGAGRDANTRSKQAYDLFDIAASQMGYNCKCKLEGWQTFMQALLMEHVLAARSDDEVADSYELSVMERYEMSGARFELDPLRSLMNAVFMFQGLTLSNSKQRLAHRAEPFLARSLEYRHAAAGGYEPGMVEDRLRAAWGLMVTEPARQEYWQAATRHMTAVRTLLTVEEFDASPEALQRLDQFEEDISLTAEEWPAFDTNPAPLRDGGEMMEQVQRTVTDWTPVVAKMLNPDAGGTDSE